jgi:hypothetical protein
MAGATMTISDSDKVLVPVWVYDKLIRDSERLAIITNYLTNEKYSTLGTVEKMLGIVKEKEGEE